MILYRAIHLDKDHWEKTRHFLAFLQYDLSWDLLGDILCCSQCHSRGQTRGKKDEAFHSWFLSSNCKYNRTEDEVNGFVICLWCWSHLTDEIFWTCKPPYCDGCCWIPERWWLSRPLDSKQSFAHNCSRCTQPHLACLLLKWSSWKLLEPERKGHSRY